MQSCDWKDKITIKFEEECTMLLDDERYAEVIAYGKDAVTKMRENKIDEGFALVEQGWKAFPESGAK